MSMLSAQCDELRAMAESVGLAMPQAATLMMEAADTILSLRDRAQDLQAENAKLRELVSILSVINKYMSQCNVTDCNQCPVCNECDESVYLEGLLGIDTKEKSWRVQWRNEDTTDIQYENVKLRKLVKRYHHLVTGTDELWSWQSVYAELQELGIEVNEC